MCSKDSERWENNMGLINDRKKVSDLQRFPLFFFFLASAELWQSPPAPLPKLYSVNLFFFPVKFTGVAPGSTLTKGKLTEQSCLFSNTFSWETGMNENHSHNMAKQSLFNLMQYNNPSVATQLLAVTSFFHLLNFYPKYTLLISCWENTALVTKSRNWAPVWCVRYTALIWTGKWHWNWYCKIDPFFFLPNVMDRWKGRVGEVDGNKRRTSKIKSPTECSMWVRIDMRLPEGKCRMRGALSTARVKINVTLALETERLNSSWWFII